MKRPTGGILHIVLGGLVLGLSACAAIDAGHEGVLVEQPFFFGHGGVDPVPSKTGRVWLAPTTHVVDVDVRPVQYSEHFDIISAENAPVSFDAFLIANVVEGRSPELIARYGPHLSTAPPGGWNAGIEVDREVKTHCCFCGQQCGIILKVKDEEVVGFMAKGMLLNVVASLELPDDFLPPRAKGRT